VDCNQGVSESSSPFWLYCSHYALSWTTLWATQHYPSFSHCLSRPRFEKHICTHHANDTANECIVVSLLPVSKIAVTLILYRDVATILPLQYLPATLGLPAPGLHGSTIQDTMQPLSDPGILTVTLLEDDVLYDPEATLCATTFQPACEVMASSNFITSLDAAGARTLDVTFDDGWTARVYPSAVAWNSLNNGAAPTIRIVPAPVSSSQPSCVHGLF
jgi:hypothetical protein